MNAPFIMPVEPPPSARGRELARTVPATCDHCGRVERFRLFSDNVLTYEQCDDLLTAYLRGLGWHVVEPDRPSAPHIDVCPSCAKGVTL